MVLYATLEGWLAMTECCLSEKLCAIDSLCSIKENWKVIKFIPRGLPRTQFAAGTVVMGDCQGGAYPP